MKHLRLPLYLLCLAATVIAAPPPNIVIFLTDDLGWGDLACYGHPEIKTPHLDHFATEGVRFTQCYSACGVCSPSRAAILTGRTPYRNGVFRWIPAGSKIHLPTSEITIAELLKAKGYDTCHAGKWHLNGKFNSPDQPQPDDHGFDHWLATQNNASPHHMNPVNYVRNGEALGRMEGASAVLASDEAIGWLAAREDKETPFFITVWTHEPHLPIESAPEYMAPYAHLDDANLRQHHGNITQLDAAFGRLMAAIDKQGYRDNTFVIFTSDNGPEGNGNNGRTRGSTGGLRERKRSDFEGGIRVPGIVRYPDGFAASNIKPGSESAIPVIGSDIFATACELADILLPDDRIIDGTSLLPALSGQTLTRSQPLYWRTHISSPDCRVALRVDDWKIVGDSTLTNFLLFDLGADPQEKNNLASSEPEVFERMKTRLLEHDAAVLADGPDWWKEDEEKQRKTNKPKQAAKLADGTDEAKRYDMVRGGSTKAHPLGAALSAEGEAFAVKKLPTPITEKTIFEVQYQSLSSSNTRNAMLVIGDKASNANLFKIGTPIGMGGHIAFAGGWGSIKSGHKASASYKPGDLFTLKVEIDPAAGSYEAEINGVHLEGDLPEDLKKIRYAGVYVKGTETAFSEVTTRQP